MTPLHANPAAGSLLGMLALGLALVPDPVAIVLVSLAAWIGFSSQPHRRPNGKRTR